MPTSATRSDWSRLFGLILLLMSPGLARALSADSTRHLLDFSSDRSVVVVDPLLDLAWGPVRPAPDFAWLNIRGATFSASWDEQWQAWGSLEEHQSIRTGAEAWWTAMNGSLPGWGRAKLGRDGGWRTADSLYVDVARAEGGFQWCAPTTSPLAGWSAKASIDRWAWGLDAAVLGTISKETTTAPSPAIEIQRSGAASNTWLQIRKWVLDERGPLGETSESLFEWTQSYILGHEQMLHDNLRAEVVAGHTRLAAADRLTGSGWDKPTTATWLGGLVTWQQPTWWVGAEAATEWTLAAHQGVRWLAACGKVWSSGQITLEHLQRPGSAEARALAPADRSLLTHAGLPMGTVWSQATSLRWTNQWAKLGDISTTLSGSWTDYGERVSVDFIKKLNDKWPVYANVNITFWTTQSLAVFQGRLIWRVNKKPSQSSV